VTDDDVRALIDAPKRRGEVSAVELAEAFLARLDAAQPLYRAMITLTPELALEQARAADAARARGEPLPLDGMPIVVKDNVDVRGVRTTVGSPMFAERVASDDASAIMRLREAGGVILGKANLHELAFGATSANEAFGAVVNPAAPDRIPGGSSGGSGAAVAADLCVAAIGTDTGGSVRLPASLCGVSGLRPTFGAVPVVGVAPVSFSLDTVGPLARSVTDVAAVHAVLSGSGVETATWLRVGVAEELLDRSDDAVADRVRSVVDVLVRLGVSIVRVDLPGWEAAVEECGRLIKAEAFAVYREALATTPELLEEGTRRRLLLAASETEEEIARLRDALARWIEVVDRALGDVDVLVLPTIPCEPPRAAGADTVRTTAAVVPYTHLVSLAHVPALSIPCGSTPTGGPVGAQLVARRGADTAVLAAGVAVQEVTEWHLAHRGQSP
jgi:aspartyl-tRNA(Asn)/glutamyl-tRNA(Gln) amidotransferase subunit A